MPVSLERVRARADATFRAIEARQEDTWLEWTDDDDPYGRYIEADPWWYVGVEWVRSVVEGAAKLQKVAPREFEKYIINSVCELAREVYAEKLAKYDDRRCREPIDERLGRYEGFAAHELAWLTSNLISRAWTEEATRLKGRRRESSTAFGASLDRVRRERGLSFDGLSDLTDVEKKALIQYVNGLREPHLSRKKQIADALGLSVIDLEEGTFKCHQNATKLGAR